MKKYELEIKFNVYVGNLEREFCAYVLGYSEYGGHDWVQALNDKFDKEEGTEFSDDFAEYLEHFHDEHGPTVCYIASEKVLRIKFDKNPTEHLPMILRRMEKFPEEYMNAYEFSAKDVKILEANLIEETTTVKKTKII